MDVVDWAYQKLGPTEIIWLVGMLMLPLVSIGDIWDFMKHPPESSDLIPAMLTTIFTCVLSLPFLMVLGPILHGTFTGCTHYPVRLDRKNQTVHVFRRNSEGGVSSYRWNDITFGMRGG
ncbi:hypothetical protein SB783_40845, partial [Paraburkholderia sp. SIMBA_009]